MENMPISAGALIGAGAASGVAGTLTSWLTGRSSQEHAANLQFDNWKKQFDYEAAYNSPVNQLRRAAQAGVNPFVSPSGSQMLQMASAHGTPNASIPAAFGSEGFGNSFSQIMQGLLAAQSAAGEGIKNTKYGALLDATIAEKLASANQSDALANLQEYDLLLQQEFGRKKMAASIMKDMSSAFNDYVNAVLERDYGAAVRLSEAFRNNSEGVLSKYKSRLTSEEYQRLVTLNKYLDEELTSQIRLTNEKAKTEQTEQGLNVQKQVTERKQQLELGTRSVLHEAEAENQYASAERSHAEAESTRNTYPATVAKIKQDAEYMRKKNQVFSARFAMECAKILGTGAMSVIGAKKIRSIINALRNLDAARAKKAVEYSVNGGSKPEGVGTIDAHVKPTESNGYNPMMMSESEFRTSYPNIYNNMSPQTRKLYWP